MTAAIFYNRETGEYDVSKKPEQVLCFPADLITDWYEDFKFSEGIINRRQAVDFLSKFVLNSNSLTFIERNDALEKNHEFKQVIPYCVLTNDKNEVFVYQRTKKGGENRLHAKWSVGVGGHVNPVENMTAKVSYEDSVFRELREEVGLDFQKRVVPLPVAALLYDDSDAVGEVHFGVVIVFNIGSTPIKTTDIALANGQWVSRTWLYENRNRFEKWSQKVIERVLYD